MPKPTLTLNGEVVEFEPGQTILEVARARGVEIPTLCYLKGRLAPLSIAGKPFIDRAPAKTEIPGHLGHLFTFPDSLNHKASTIDRGSGILMGVVHTDLLPETDAVNTSL